MTQQASAAFEPVAVDGLCLGISVDDVRPERGFGGERERGPLGFLLRLYEELGCKATLFVQTDWQGRLPLRQHLDWLGWLREQPCFEVACHGHLHAVEPGSADPAEFRGIDAEAAEGILVRRKELKARTMDEGSERYRASRRQEGDTRGLTSAAADVKLSARPQQEGTVLPPVDRNVSFR